MIDQRPERDLLQTGRFCIWPVAFWVFWAFRYGEAGHFPGDPGIAA